MCLNYFSAFRVSFPASWASSLDSVRNSYRLSSESLTHLSSPIYLSGFPFLSASSKYPIPRLVLTSSHILFAAGAWQKINLPPWDLQFSVLVPSALSSSQLHLCLLPGWQTTKKLNLCHRPSNPRVILVTHTGFVDEIDLHPCSCSLFGTNYFSDCCRYGPRFMERATK